MICQWFCPSDDEQREIKFKELKLENERNKQILIERIEQLQNEIDSLLKEKKTMQTSPSETDESISKSRSKVSSTINESSSTSNTEKLLKSDVHRPTIVPTTSPVPTPPKRTTIPARSPTPKTNAIRASDNPTIKSTKPTSQVNHYFTSFVPQMKLTVK